jgi:glycosyltransferase involved in cell wall biosynthesis
MRISIITVVYNGATHIEQTILSVLNQTYKNIEYIIIDGGSTDATHSIIEKYRPQISKVIIEPDNGIYDAMNKGIHASTGDVIAFINADDWYESNAVQLAVETFSKHPESSVVFGGVKYHNLTTKQQYTRLPSLSRFNLLYKGTPIFHSSMFVRKELYKQNNFDSSYKIAADTKFIAQTYLSGYVYTPILEVIANFRTGGASSSILTIFWESIRLKEEVKIGTLENLLSSTTQLLLNMAHRTKHLILQKK